MGTRMFAAVYPPVEVREEIADFLLDRPGLRWTSPEQMHLTLAFLESVPEHSIEPMAELMAEACRRSAPFTCQLGGAGAFPHPDRPAVLWLGVRSGGDELTALAQRLRQAGHRAGARPDGRAFSAHLTLARPSRSSNATRWIRVLDTLALPPWEVTEVHLVESVLQGHGHRPRHSTLEVLPLATGGGR